MALVKGAGVGMVLGRSAGNSTPFGAAFAASFSTRPPQKDFFVFSSLLARLHKSKAKLFADSVLLMKNTVLQIDVIASNRLKQINSLSGMYGQIYGSERLKAFASALVKSFRLRSRHLLLGATVFQASSFDWDEMRASETDIIKYSQQIDNCKELTMKTLTCQKCQKRLCIDKEVEGVDYCRCKDSPKSVYGLHSENVDGWTPFLERKDILVWRKEHPTMKGMYFYKMYGKFDDVTADEFIQVQTDTSDFRMEWDNSTAKCSVVDKKTSSDQEIYYWEVIWPRFFANRYYCCSRQLVHNFDGGRTVLISKSAQHQKCKDNQSRSVVGVEDYESILTVQPATSSDQMGLEFALSGFENPGVKLPESVITWVAIRGMPEFMGNLRKACLQYRKKKEVENYPPHQLAKSTETSSNDESSYIGGSTRMYA